MSNYKKTGDFVEIKTVKQPQYPHIGLCSDVPGELK
jgi:hypothetical protein